MLDALEQGAECDSNLRKLWTSRPPIRSASLAKLTATSATSNKQTQSHARNSQQEQAARHRLIIGRYAVSTLRQRPRRAPAKSDPTPQGLPKLDSRWQLAKPEFDGEWVPISQVYDLQMGKTPSRDVPEYWNNGDHNWVSIKDLGSYGKYVGKTSETISERGRKESGIKAVPADTLLMSFKLSLGKASITAEETFTNEAIMAFLDKGAYEVDIDYMWYQLRSKDWSAGTNTAVMGKTLNKKTLGSTLIRVPPIAKQREVARRLDSAENVLSLL